jgi:hypothetical protein
MLEEEFEETWLNFFSASILHYEVLNLVTLCSGLMRDTGFPKNEDSRFLRYSVIAAIAADYLNESGMAFNAAKQLRINIDAIRLALDWDGKRQFK